MPMLCARAEVSAALCVTSLEYLAAIESRRILVGTTIEET